MYGSDVYHLRKGPKSIDLTTDHLREDASFKLIDDRMLRQESSATPSSGILHLSTVAERHLAIVEDEKDRKRTPALSY
jgi:hypothetical protein